MKTINEKWDLFVSQNERFTHYLGKAINLYPFMLEQLQDHIFKNDANDDDGYLESMLCIISAIIREKNPKPNKPLMVVYDDENDWTLHEVEFIEML